MKKIYIVLAGFVALAAVGFGVVAADASAKEVPARPAWVMADGKIDYNKIPDTAQIPYTCWSGKAVTLSGKTMRERATVQPQVGSAEYAAGVAKSKELSKIPGVVTMDARGGEVITIDDTNPQVVNVMKKYEAKEVPQCQ